MLCTDVNPTKPPERLFEGAKPVWAQEATGGRNQFVSFAKEIEYAGQQGACWLHLFADTRYRLYVNEHYIAYGPGRFVTQYPEYDSHELSGWLQAGLNRVRVEVNYYGASSYQTMPDGMPGFIADGGTQDGAITFATPGDWKCCVHHAWDAQAPLFSFAQNPVEICDTRILEAELGQRFTGELRVLSGEAAPWGPLRRRQVGYPHYAAMEPVKVNVAGRLVNGKQLLAIQANDPEFARTKHDGQRYQQRILSWLYAEAACKCELDCLWVDLELNGEPIARKGATPFGNHETATLSLRKGWNFLAGRYCVLLEHWTLLFGYPVDARISWHAEPDRAVLDSFYASPFEKETQPLPRCDAVEAFVAPQGWMRQSGDVAQATPARRMAWDEFEPDGAVRNLPIERFAEVQTLNATSASWCMYFGDEYYGHPVIEVEAPAGAVLDVAYDDWQRQDGATNLYSANPFTDAADRFILRGGRQRVEVCNPRGGIYLQVTLRTSGPAPVDLTLWGVQVRSRRMLRNPDEAFAFGDAIMDWAMAKSLHTLVASTDEGYADCPWRERGSYIGDSYVNLHLHQLLSSDFSIPARVLRIFGEAQLPNGQLAPVAPAWHRRPHEDFTLIWLQALRDYWAMTGETQLLEAMWPRILHLWESPVWKTGASGLWDAVGTHIFLDWGKLNEEVVGEANAVLNLFRYEGARATADIATALGKNAEAQAFAAQAAKVKGALEATLWDAAQGRFRASLGAQTPAVHANVLALRYGVGDAAALLRYLEPLLKGNFRYGVEKGQGSGYIELYFFTYLFEALAQHGRHDWVAALIREHYGFLKTLGYPTLNECFSRAHNHTGSCCHSWSGAAGIYLARYGLGLRQREAGNPDAWLFDPQAVGIEQAMGAIPHRNGLISVQWRRVDGVIEATLSAPDGVEVDDRTRGAC